MITYAFGYLIVYIFVVYMCSSVT